MIYTFITSVIISSALYIYLHIKTRINIRFLFIDNIIVAVLSFLIANSLINNIYTQIFVISILVLGLACILTMIRFWRTPRRKVKDIKHEIISPADGNIIYIKKIGKAEIPISVKGKNISQLSELTKTELLQTPCWLIGTNMTLFDVHKNCSPISGKIILNKHFLGRFESLKDAESVIANERNTYVIQNNEIVVGIIQIASKRVRRIDSYVSENQIVQKGEWIGMIRFGSQVDLILPEFCRILVDKGQQVYTIKTAIADYQ